jgi:hypothetical protein
VQAGEVSDVLIDLAQAHSAEDSQDDRYGDEHCGGAWDPEIWDLMEGSVALTAAAASLIFALEVSRSR